MSRRVVVRAPAKINLTLEVVARRPDGYHELRSVFATVDLFDRVAAGLAKRLEVAIRPPLDAAGGEDLVSRAARSLASVSGREPRAHVLVEKRIPAAAGLGGGSSDASATLRALASLWRTGPADLVALAATIGSDVPFFASGARFAEVAGRGERVRPLAAPAAELWIALVVPRARLATASVFAALTEAERRGDGAATAALADAFDRGVADPAALRAHARNDLTSAAERLCPWIVEARAAAAAKGIALELTGSGPALFAIADDRADALRIARILRRAGLRARAHVLGA